MTADFSAKAKLPLLLPYGESSAQKYFYNPLGGLLDINASSKICNRCGACAQACPSYKALNGEVYAPRGRNQMLRFILERRISADVCIKDVLRPAHTCIMCGECSNACAAFVPTAKHMSAINRAFGLMPGGVSRKLYIKLFNRYPAFFYSLKRIPYNLPADEKTDSFYLPENDGLKHFGRTLGIIGKKHSYIRIIKSGLHLTETALTQNLSALKTVLNNIKAEYEAVLSPNPLPIITDNIETFRILKQSPELGAEYENIAANAYFITDYLPLKLRPKSKEIKKILAQNNNIFFQDDKIPQKIKDFSICGESGFFVELKLGAHSAGLMPYHKIKAADIISKSMARGIAANKTDLLIVLSARDEKFFTKLLRACYPRTKVLHISNLAEYFDEE